MDANSKWNKKRDEGYINNLNQLTNDKNTNDKNDKNDINDKNNTITNDKNETIFPMLAQDYTKQKSKLKFPAYLQPKLDGYRMIFNSSTGNCTSRQGKEFDIIKNTKLYKELQSIKSNIILDGELYIHGGIFEHLGILRKKKLSNEDKLKIEQIEYHVYDIVNVNDIFEERLNNLKNIFDTNNFEKVKLVKSISIENENQLNENHLSFVNNNYEGTIIRNKTGKYKCKFRSTDLLKYKDFQDSEYKIVDYTSEIDTTGNNKNLIVWICKTSNGDLFNIRPKGTKEERQFLYEECQKNFNIFKNRNLWVKYFELTDKQIPRFPCTKTESYLTYIRDIIE